MRATLTKTPVRFAADAILGLGVFAALTAATLGPSTAAGLLGLEAASTTVLSGSPILAQSLASSQFLTTPSYGFIGLATVFSTLFALNFAFVRHVRRAVAPIPVTSLASSPPKVE